MDRNLAVNGRKKASSRKRKAAMKNLPLKVVYISNPKWVYTSASDFRALVQELTGQDAEFPDPDNFPAVVDTAGKDLKKVGGDEDVPAAVENSGDVNKSQCEILDDIFTTQMMESLAGLWPPALLCEADRLV